MQYEKPLIFIYPISDTLKNLKKAIESSGQPIDIYEIEDLRELLQTIPALGQSLVLGSNAKKCAKFLQAGKKIIKKNETKVVIISQKQYPRKTVDKLMKFGLNDIIFEPVPAKTLMYKINLALRSLKVPTKQELEKKFKAEQAEKEDEQEQSFNNKDSNDSSNEDSVDENENSLPSKAKEEESEEELLASLNNQKSLNPNQEDSESFNENEMNLDQSDYDKRMAALSEDSGQESEEELLSSLQNQSIKSDSDDQDNDFGSNNVDLNNAYEDRVSALEADDENLSEEDLLADLQNQKIKRSNEDGFDASSMDTGSSDQKVENEYDPYANEEDDDDEEEMISLSDFANAKSSEDSTNLEGQKENYQTHMEGKGNTEHLEDDEHEMSEEDMEYAEMEALSEISNLNTKMRGDNSSGENLDDLMEGDVHSNDSINDLMEGDVHSNDRLSDNMQGDVNLNELEEGNLEGDLHESEQLNSLMEGDINLSELAEGGNLEGAVTQEYEEGGQLEGDLLASLEEQGNLEGERLTKEKNIKTHYDGEGINHQDTYDPLEHTANNESIDGNLKGDVYENTNYNDDDMSSLLADDVDLNDLAGDGSTDEMGGHLEGDLLMDLADDSGEMEGLIADEHQAGNLNGFGNTDQINESDLEGANNSIMADKGGLKGHSADGTEHIETHYNTDFASKLDKKKKLNPMMEFETEEDFYGQAHLPNGSKKPGMDQFDDDLYGDFGHTNSLSKDKQKRETEQFSEFEDTRQDTDFGDHRKKHQLEMPYTMEYDEEGNPISNPNSKMQEFDGEYGPDGRPRNPNAQIQYDLESDWSKRDPKLKPKYSMEEFEDNRKVHKMKRPKPELSIDEQYQVYDDMDLDNLIDEFGADDEFGEEHLDELKEMAKDLKSHFYDDYEPAMVQKLNNFEDESPESDNKPKQSVEKINPEIAMGLDTLISISQIYQTITLRPNDAIYQMAKLLWSDQNALCCFIQFEGKKVAELYNSITDPIVSDQYLNQEDWEVLKNKSLQKLKSTSSSFWEGSDEEGTPKLFSMPCYDETNQFGAIIAYFPNNVELTKRSFVQNMIESLNRIAYSALPPTHSIKQQKQKAEDHIEKESVIGKVKGFYKENFIEEEVDKNTGTKGSRFGNWLKKKIDQIAS